MNVLLELATLRATHASTLELLDQVSAYLARLPRVPTTLDLCRRVEEHLSDPNASALNARARLQGTRRLHGGRYTTVGVPLLEVDINGAALTLSTGIGRTPSDEAKGMVKLLVSLRERVTIELRPGALARHHIVAES